MNILRIVTLKLLRCDVLPFVIFFLLYVTKNGILEIFRLLIQKNHVGLVMCISRF